MEYVKGPGSDVPAPEAGPRHTHTHISLLVYDHLTTQTIKSLITKRGDGRQKKVAARTASRKPKEVPKRKTLDELACPDVGGARRSSLEREREKMVRKRGSPRDWDTAR